MKAHRGLIGWYESRFKTTKTWTSLELLLHIYLVMFPGSQNIQSGRMLKLSCLYNR